MIRFIGIVVLIMTNLLTSLPCRGQAHPNPDIQAYVLQKLSDHDIVFIGTTHRKPPILDLMAELIPQLHSVGVTHLALEIASDQQEHLDRFLATGTGMEFIKLHDAIDCPAYRRLLSVLQRLSPNRRPRVIAIDLPVDSYGGPISRDEHMAMTLAATLQSHPEAKILAKLGSLHVLRKLQWQKRIAGGHEAVRTYLSLRRPDLRIFSVIHVIDAAAEACDFSRRLGPLPGMVALDVDSCFNGWRLGITSSMALQQTQAHELVDGVIVH
jgi:hypothetical protein